MKKCNKCDRVLPLGEFPKRRGAKDGARSQCRECLKKLNAIYRANNKETVKESKARYRESNRQKINKQGAIYRATNPLKVKKSKEAWREGSRDAINQKAALHRKENTELYRARYLENKEYNKNYLKVYRKENKHAVNASAAKRRASKLQATPKWLTKCHLEQMREFYKQAQILSKEIGQVCHVDHIVPLQGENVCGLHVPWNLQILIGTDNLSKGNKF